jgi:hypothetical protein
MGTLQRPRPTSSSSSACACDLGVVTAGAGAALLPATGLADGIRCGAHGRRCCCCCGQPPEADADPAALAAPRGELPPFAERDATAAVTVATEDALDMWAPGFRLPLVLSCERSDCCGSIA